MKDVYRKEGSIEKLGRKHAKESKEVNRQGNGRIQHRKDRYREERRKYKRLSGRKELWKEGSKAGSVEEERKYTGSKGDPGRKEIITEQRNKQSKKEEKLVGRKNKSLQGRKALLRIQEKGSMYA